MTTPDQTNINATAVDDPALARKSNADAVSLVLTLVFLSASPLMLLAAHLLLTKDPPIAPGVWPEETTNDYILGGIVISNLVLTAAGLFTIWFFYSKAIPKIILTLLAILSVPAMWFGLLLVTLEKTNKWL